MSERLLLKLLVIVTDQSVFVHRLAWPVRQSFTFDATPSLVSDGLDLFCQEIPQQQILFTQTILQRFVVSHCFVLRLCA